MSETTFLSAILFLLFALISGSLIQWLVAGFRAYKPPVSILWFAFGMLISMVTVLIVPEVPNTLDPSSTHIEINPEHPLGLLGIGIAEAARIHSSVLYYVVLPILLYDATQQISWHHFRKTLKTGLLLAIVGVVFQVAVIGLLMQYSFTKPATGQLDSNRSLDEIGPYLDQIRTYNDEIRPFNLFNSTHTPYTDSPFLNFTNTPYNDSAQIIVDSNPAPARLLGFLWRGPSVMKGELQTPRGMGALRQTGPSLSFSMMTAAAVASTDPIAVISILEEMDAPAQFASLFDCEALINDGSSIFLFTFFKSLTRGHQQTWLESLGRFATLLIVGPLSGFVAASLMYRWLKHYRWYPYDKTIAVVFMAYLVFYVAEIYLLTSGPLAIVVYGLYFKAYAKAAFEAEATEVHHHLVRGCATAATSVVFIISGVASFRMIWDALTARANLVLPADLPELAPEGLIFPGQPDIHLEGFTRLGNQAIRGRASSELWRVPVFYLFLIAARFLMIGVFFPLLKRFLGGFTWKEYLLLSWGGLRGAVCLILALLIEQDDHIDKDLSASAALYIASSAFLILFANGITFEWLYKLLRPYKANVFRQIYLKKVMKLIDKEYYNEVALLQQHWLFERSWALVYADKLVPRLAALEMDTFGKLHLTCPKTTHVLRDLEDLELRRVLPKPEPSSRLSSPSPALKATAREPPTVVANRLAPRFARTDTKNAGNSPRLMGRDPSKTEENAGHSTAAVLQRLRRPPDAGLDLEMNLRILVNEEEEEPETLEDIISRQASKSQEDFAAAMPQTVPVPSPPPSQRLIEADEAPAPRPFKRIPGYKYDSVVRIRSEPYGAALDAAQLEKWEIVEAEQPADSRGKISRSMSVPNQLDAAIVESQSVACPPALNTDREGEMLIMTINTMRQQYKRMYEQSFISGTVFVGFMSTADVVSDFALMDVKRRSKMRAWREILKTRLRLENELVYMEDDLESGYCCGGGRRETEIDQNISGFEVEWKLTVARLRGNKRRSWGKWLVDICRCSRRSRTPIVGRPKKWRQWTKARWTSLWSALGPRQTFPALDDLQLICAFVDVHEELLMRGDSGLRTMLGPRLLSAFEAQTLKAKSTVQKLIHRYPDSFTYAMICHAAIFLVNLKIQLTEEQYERGLLLADDQETISERLKEQLVSITKFHPPFLFT